jgi:hypothetical protein
MLNQGKVIQYPGNSARTAGYTEGQPREGKAMDVAEGKSLARIYDLRQYALSKRVTFNFGLLGRDDDQQDGIQIPIGIVYRLHFLGRAYNFTAVKLVEPQGKTYLSYKTCQQLIVELEQMQSLIKDPVVEHYTRKLVNFLIAKRAFPDQGLLVKSL